MMHNPKIETKLMLGTTEIAKAFLLVVPDRAERIDIDGAEYQVLERRFHLKTSYNGGTPCGFSQSCTLTVKAFKQPTLNC